MIFFKYIMIAYFLLLHSPCTCRKFKQMVWCRRLSCGYQIERIFIGNIHESVCLLSTLVNAILVQPK